MNIGDMVYIDWAYDNKYEPTLVAIKDIADNGIVCDVRRVNHYDGRIETVEISVKYDRVFDSYEECKDFVDKYYYDKLCRGCTYEHCGSVFTCKDCTHAKRTDYKPGFDRYICEKNGIVVGETYQAGHEICKNFSPKRPVDADEYGSWELYDEYLRKCEYNKECPHHKYSAHKTCDYSRYMNNYVYVCADNITYKEREVSWFIVTRKRWVEQNIFDGDYITCIGVAYKPIKNKNGTYKKGTVNNVDIFTDNTRLKYR